MLTFHKARRTNRADLLRLDQIIFREAAYSVESWHQELLNPASHVYLAYEENEPVGFISILLSGGDAEVVKVGVVPSFRRRKVASGLINHALHALAAERCLIDVSEKNTAALLFYQKLRFVDLARRRSYYNDGSDAVVMELVKVARPQ
ncbi:MAG TPA: N-acetyltransferase [Turneriella sp.]|nr:N-acetyltransferase [Turneriella sp.]